MSKWKTVDRCKNCGHIYYDYTTIRCPDCGTENYKKVPAPSNMYCGNRKVAFQAVSTNEHLEKVMVRKRFFYGWEIKV